MKKFDQFIRYLMVTGVIFAVFYALLPDIAGVVVKSYGMYFGPLIVVGLFLLAYFKKPSEK